MALHRVQAFVVQASFDDTNTETQGVFSTLSDARDFMVAYVDNQIDLTFDSVTVYRDDVLPGGVGVEAWTHQSHGGGTKVNLWIQGTFRYL